MQFIRSSIVICHQVVFFSFLFAHTHILLIPLNQIDFLHTTFQKNALMDANNIWKSEAQVLTPPPWHNLVKSVLAEGYKQWAKYGA